MTNNRLNNILIYILLTSLLIKGFQIYAGFREELHYIPMPPKVSEAAILSLSGNQKTEPEFPESKFMLGNEVLLQDLSFFSGKRVGLVTNHSGILSDGRFFLDELLRNNVYVIKLFSPEHGIRGNETYTDIDSITGIPIISLFDAKVKPSSSDLDSIDVLIYDIQDVGARFYTFTSTLLNIIEAASENNKPLFVCDRPIIIDPDYVDGFMLDSTFKSFVGTIPVPVTYGMTAGELAMYINGELYSNRADIKISKMQDYDRSIDYDRLDLKWVKPSPSMFTSRTALVYPATCFLEGTNISEGRGTDKPFEYAGAPWINSFTLADSLNKYGLTGIIFEPASFKPVEVISAHPPKFLGEDCNGVFFNITDKGSFEPIKAGIALLVELYKAYPQFTFNQNNFIDKLAGTDRLRIQILDGKSYNDIVNSYEKEVMDFDFNRYKYLLYR